MSPEHGAERTGKAKPQPGTRCVAFMKATDSDTNKPSQDPLASIPGPREGAAAQDPSVAPALQRQWQTGLLRPAQLPDSTPLTNGHMAVADQNSHMGPGTRAKESNGEEPDVHGLMHSCCWGSKLQVHGLPVQL